MYVSLFQVKISEKCNIKQNVVFPLNRCMRFGAKISSLVTVDFFVVQRELRKKSDVLLYDI